MDCLTADRVRRNVLQPILTIRDGISPVSAILPIETKDNELLILSGDINGRVTCHCAASQIKLWEIKFPVGILGFCLDNNGHDCNAVLVHTRNGRITKVTLSNPPQQVDDEICCAQYSYCVAKQHGDYLAVPSGEDNNSIDLWRLYPKKEALHRDICSTREKHGRNIIFT